GGLLGLVELAGTDGVGRDDQLALVSVLSVREPGRDGGSDLGKVQAMRSGAFGASDFGLGKAARARLLPPWQWQHVLYLLPLPWDHRARVAVAVNDVEPGRTDPLYSTRWPTPQLLLVFDQDIAIAAQASGLPQAGGAGFQDLPASVIFGSYEFFASV